MRALLTALAAGVVMAGPVMAEPWSNAEAGLKFDAPAGWTVRQIPSEGMTYVLANAGAQECHILAMPRAETASIGADRIRAAGLTPIPAASWAGMPAALPVVFGDNATLAQSSVDSEPFWPINRADFNGSDRVVHAAIQFRPGKEYWGFCFSRTGADDAATYDGVLRSIAGTNDAELQAAIADAERNRRMGIDQHNSAAGQAQAEGMREGQYDRGLEQMGRSN